MKSRAVISSREFEASRGFGSTPVPPECEMGLQAEVPVLNAGRESWFASRVNCFPRTKELTATLAGLRPEGPP